MINNKQIFKESIEVNGAVIQNQYTEEEIQALSVPEGKTAILQDINGNLWCCTKINKKLVGKQEQLFKESIEVNGAVIQKLYTEEEIQALSVPEGKTAILQDTEGNLWSCAEDSKFLFLSKEHLDISKMLTTAQQEQARKNLGAEKAWTKVYSGLIQTSDISVNLNGYTRIKVSFLCHNGGSLWQEFEVPAPSTTPIYIIPSFVEDMTTSNGDQIRFYNCYLNVDTKNNTMRVDYPRQMYLATTGITVQSDISRLYDVWAR